MHSGNVQRPEGEAREGDAAAAEVAGRASQATASALAFIQQGREPPEGPEQRRGRTTETLCWLGAG